MGFLKPMGPDGSTPIIFGALLLGVIWAWLISELLLIV